MRGRARITGIMTAVIMAGVIAYRLENRRTPPPENSRQRKRYRKKFRKQSCKSPPILRPQRYSLFRMLRRRQKQNR